MIINWEKWKELQWKMLKYWLAIPRIVRLSAILFTMLIISILGWFKILAE